jgi:hypothetical protein
VITLLGTRAAVDDKMKHKATSAETLESLIIDSMLWLEVVVVAMDRLETCLKCLRLSSLLLQRPRGINHNKPLAASVCDQNKIIVIRSRFGSASRLSHDVVMTQIQFTLRRVKYIKQK